MWVPIVWEKPKLKVVTPGCSLASPLPQSVLSQVGLTEASAGQLGWQYGWAKRLKASPKTIRVLVYPSYPVLSILVKGIVFKITISPYGLAPDFY